MEQQQLREQLDQLAQEIEGLQASGADKDRLVNLIADIESQLDDSASSDQSENLSDQVDSLISAFEAEHPTVAGILNRIMVTLSSMGV